MKKYAIFLPQFHEIPENDEWWGKGFTEWENVKKGVPLFKGHMQPKEPLNNNYYNLLDKSIVIWQTELLKKYKINGLAYYHYYFNGKKLLEKPAENLLKWKDINQNFFFIWANHSWIRSWEGKQEILLEQRYGGKNAWEEHFQYLLQFFKDQRYEKKSNKPVFGIFSPDIFCKEDMFMYFNKRCIEEGFSGIYIFESYGSTSGRTFPFNFNDFVSNLSSNTSGIAIRQPIFCEYETYRGLAKKIYVYYRYLRKKSRVKILKPFVLNGNNIVDKYLKMKIPNTDKDIISGIFFGWDNTVRHKNRGYIITEIDKAHFMKFMDHEKKSEYLLINAWNEWAEGMILEPTKENGYNFLEWIKEWTELNEHN